MTGTAASVEQYLDIEELLHEWARRIDHGPYDEVAALFTEDGRFCLPGVDVRTRPALHAEFSSRRKDRTSRHVLTNLRVRMVGPRRATATGVQTVYRHDGPPPHRPLPVSVFDFDDELELGDDGMWRIAAHVLTRRFTGVPR